MAPSGYSTRLTKVKRRGNATPTTPISNQPMAAIRMPSSGRSSLIFAQVGRGASQYLAQDLGDRDDHQQQAAGEGECGFHGGRREIAEEQGHAAEQPQRARGKQHHADDVEQRVEENRR